MMYWSGSYARPAVTTNPLGDDSCTKCHDDVFARRRSGSRSMNGHYHAFLPRWQAIDANAAHCTTCHPAHPEGAPANQYMSLDRVRQTCEDCHRVLGEGEVE
jgi:hypothetical protein